MKTTITRARLAEAVQAVKGLVSKDALSLFSRIRLDASGCLSVTGSNGDVQVEWRMDGEIIDQGAVTVPGTAFAAFVGAMPEGGVEIEGEAVGNAEAMREALVQIVALARQDQPRFAIISTAETALAKPPRQLPRGFTGIPLGVWPLRLLE